jgi:hypothetical protein
MLGDEMWSTVRRALLESSREAERLEFLEEYFADGADAGDDVVVLPGRAVHAVRYYAERHDDADLTLLSPAELDDLDTDQIWVLDRLTQGPSDEGRELLEVGLARSYELVGEQHVANIDIRQYRRR